MNDFLPCGIKLVSGEEIFASIESMDIEGSVIITKAYQIFRKFESGSSGIKSKLMYSPWMDYCFGELHIDRKNILVCEPLKPELLKLYVDMVLNTTNMFENKDPEDFRIAGEKPLIEKKSYLH